ncbi:ATP-dependent zinc metalloprotease FtsH [Buchnera aphidicola (Stegophylla sp.)]|uniref:ATP-dependent zinc metalloprotease FtsH n=1 Tax=Buchnera aphidicola (Stegophylla sp.) TaxID=2315800 RepID=A0A4D6Y9W5_9GAMM|nr:ATP-dependent zinc metalloprotease FtsH [Buchnera aphidicola (Stegophylla sp.)]
MAKNFIFWLMVLILFIFIMYGFNIHNVNDHNIDYTTFLSLVNKHEIQKVCINDNYINIITKDHSEYSTYMPLYDSKLLNRLLSHDVIISSQPPQKHSIIFSIFISWFPTILLIGLWLYFMYRMKNSHNHHMKSFGKSKTYIFSKNEIRTTFDDVAGCDEAKEEVRELVEYLKKPKKFQKLGGKIPKGILMIGPPGTGKTLLAKAIAGEAQVSFLTMSGSDFVEMFVGVGASRVRDVFQHARKLAPCIIFIDEIDAVGRRRGGMTSGGNDEREQTLNQMLVEMDGFKDNENIILVAATNRPDVLDSALLRPGRFDRQVIVPLPDIQGREKILQIHIKNVPISSDVNCMVIARGTPGFSGADLSNLVNESVLCAARSNKKFVSMSDFEQSKDRMMMGAERKSMMMTEKQKEFTAYHESGHVIIGRLVPEHDPAHKVTIVPRGLALGITFFLPESDIVSVSREKLESQISTLYGGRLAEEIIYGVQKISTGSMNDIKIATSLARNMIIKWGFSEKLGPILYSHDDDDNQIFFNHTSLKSMYISNETSRIIDEEIKLLIDRNYNRSKKLLNENLDILHAMKDALMKYETLDADQIDDLMNRKKVKDPVGWNNINK